MVPEEILTELANSRSCSYALLNIIVVGCANAQKIVPAITVLMSFDSAEGQRSLLSFR